MANYKELQWLISSPGSKTGVMSYVMMLFKL